jgi:hypothetical protein
VSENQAAARLRARHGAIHTHTEGGVNAEVLTRPLGATPAEHCEPAHGAGNVNELAVVDKTGRAPFTEGRT